MNYANTSTSTRSEAPSGGLAIWGCGPRIACMSGPSGRGQEVSAGEVNASIDLSISVPCVGIAGTGNHTLAVHPTFDLLERVGTPPSEQISARVEVIEPDTSALGLPVVPSLRSLFHELATNVASKTGGPGLLLVPELWTTSTAAGVALKPFTDAGWRLGTIEAACPRMAKGTRLVGGDPFFAWVNDAGRVLATPATPQASVALALVNQLLGRLEQAAPPALWKQWLLEEGPQAAWFTRQQIAERVRRSLIGHTLHLTIGGREDPVLAVSRSQRSSQYEALARIRLHVEVPNPMATRDWLNAAAQSARLSPWSGQPTAIVGSPDLKRFRKAVEEQAGEVVTIEVNMLTATAIGAGRTLAEFLPNLPPSNTGAPAPVAASSPPPPAPAPWPAPKPSPRLPPRDLPDLRPPEPPPEAPRRNLVQRLLGRTADPERTAAASDATPGAQSPAVAQKPAPAPDAPLIDSPQTTASVTGAPPVARRTTAPLVPLDQVEPLGAATAPVTPSAAAPDLPRRFDLPWAHALIEVRTGQELKRPVEVEVSVDSVRRRDCSVHRRGPSYFIESTTPIPSRALVLLRYEPLFND